MSTIGTTTFVEDGNRNYFTLQNEQYLRKLKAFSWSDIRFMNVGVLYSVEGTNDFTGGLWIGLVSSRNAGTNVGVLHPRLYISKSVGGGIARAGNYGGYNARGNVMGGYDGPNPEGTSLTGSLYEYSVSLGSIENTAGTVNIHHSATTENPQRKCIFAVRFEKLTANRINGASCFIPDYTVADGTNVNQTDISLCSCIANCVTPVLNNYTMYRTNGDFLTCDFTNYPMDTINVMVSGSGTFRIYQIAVAMGQY